MLDSGRRVPTQVNGSAWSVHNIVFVYTPFLFLFVGFGL